MSKTHIIYKDVAPGADEDALTSAAWADARGVMKAGSATGSNAAFATSGILPQPSQLEPVNLQAVCRLETCRRKLYAHARYVKATAGFATPTAA